MPDTAADLLEAADSAATAAADTDNFLSTHDYLTEIRMAVTITVLKVGV